MCTQNAELKERLQIELSRHQSKKGPQSPGNKNTCYLFASQPLSLIIVSKLMIECTVMAA